MTRPLLAIVVQGLPERHTPEYLRISQSPKNFSSS
jgi:hypothetical protein